jgi:hypothetical protein
VRRNTLLVMIALAVVSAACGDDGTTDINAVPAGAPSTSAAVTTTTEPSTTIAPTTTLDPQPTTTAPATTAPTTTVPVAEGEVWVGTTAIASTAIEAGVDYSRKLDDLRVGEHPGYTRLVFDFTEDGAAPAYLVMYREPPFIDIPGDVVPVDGEAFVYVNLFPARTVDFESKDLTPTYEGPRRFSPGSENLSEVVFISDFEATMEWVIGIGRVAPFRVFTLDGPPRVVLDIADGPGVFFLNMPNFEVGTEPYEAALLRSVATPQEALDALFDGPTAAEAAAGLALVTSEATGAELVSLDGEVAVVQLQGGCNSGGSTFSVANLIGPTLKQFADVVKILDPDGETADLDGPGDSIPACLEP